jgi:hypothetical protein
MIVPFITISFRDLSKRIREPTPAPLRGNGMSALKEAKALSNHQTDWSSGKREQAFQSPVFRLAFQRIIKPSFPRRQTIGLGAGSRRDQAPHRTG